MLPEIVTFFGSNLKSFSQAHVISIMIVYYGSMVAFVATIFITGSHLTAPKPPKWGKRNETKWQPSAR